MIEESLDNPRIGLRKDLAEQILAVRRAHPFDISRGEMNLSFERVADLQISEYRAIGQKKFQIRLGKDFGRNLRKDRDFLIGAFIQAYKRMAAPIFMMDADQLIEATGYDIARARQLLHWVKAELSHARYELKDKEVERRRIALARERGVEPDSLRWRFDNDLLSAHVDVLYPDSPVYSEIFVLSGKSGDALAYIPPKDIDIYGRNGMPFGGLEMYTTNDQTGATEPFALSGLRQMREAMAEADAAKRAKPIVKDEELGAGSCDARILRLTNSKK